MFTVRQFRHTDFLAVLKWKQGERMALRTFAPDSCALHALIEVPPAGDFDHEIQRVLTPTEHVKAFGRRLREAWGNRVAFIDATHVDDAAHKEGFSRHPLIELVERARLAGALACPAVGFDNSTEYRTAVRRFATGYPALPVCIRVQSSHLDSPTFQSDLRALLKEVNCEPLRCYLVLDFRALAIPKDEAELVEMLSDRIAELPLIHKWVGFAVVFTSFPGAIKLKPGEVKEYDRLDLSLYERLISNPKGLIRTPMYGDYAVDPSPVVKPQRRTPSAHLRYSTDKIYAIAKGTTVKKPYGYEAIFPVADALVGQRFFAGPLFSEGDAFIDGLQKRAVSKGNAAKWRWASTDHHLRVNSNAIAAMYRLPTIATTASPNTAPTQIEMFALSDDSAKDSPQR